MKKYIKNITIGVFVAAFMLTAVPQAHAGFFDLFKINLTQPAQTINFQATIEDETYVKGDRNDTIKSVQQELANMRIYKGSVTGLIGPKTERAIMSFQKGIGLPVTGELDAETAGAILGTPKLRGGRNRTETRLCNSQTDPWIKVLSPNGGESYIPGQQITVEWEDCNVGQTPVGISLVEYPSNSVAFLGSWVPASDGSQLVTIPSSTPIGEYLINIATPPDPDLDDISAEDSSDNVFNIGFLQQSFPSGPNIYYGDEACNMEVVTPDQGADIDVSGFPGGIHMTTMIKIDYDQPINLCAWGSFEGIAGSVEMIDLDTGEILANAIDLGYSAGLWNITRSEPFNTYAGDGYFHSTLQFVDPLPTNISNNVYLHYVEDNSNGSPNPDELYMPVNWVNNPQPSCGVDVEFDGSNAVIISQDPNDPDVAEFEINFEVEAYDCDAQIPSNTKLFDGINNNGDGIVFNINNVNPGGFYNVLAEYLDCDSWCNATLDGYEIYEGNTATFTLKVVMNSLDFNEFYMSLESINWGDGAYDEFYTNGLPFNTQSVILNSP